ncbi:MAG: 3-hydroxybutyrate oligomer hydrolase family protein [Pseudomonadota bacterium]
MTPIQNRLTLLAAVMLLGGLSACRQASDAAPDPVEPLAEENLLVGVQITERRDGDDLVTAGLGLSGLTSTAPAPSDSAAPSASSLRQLAFYSAWTGLAALNPAGGLGAVFEDLPVVTGREFSTFRTLPDRNSPFRVVVQLPDQFDPTQACLVLAPASGSRGVYGAVPLVAPWALPRGCAVAYTDKGAGTDIHRYADNSGVGLDGRRVNAAETATGLTAPELDSADVADTVAISHAHSADHPEADWGRHVLDAAVFALDVLNAEFDDELTPSTVQIIAAGLSNGGGAVLRAAEQDEQGLIDAVMALMPNITAPDAPHLYEYATEAALLQPCALGDLDSTMDMVLGNPLVAAAGQQRCAGLARAGLIEAPEPEQARQRLLERGFDEPALSLGAVNVILDVWRSVGVTYSSAYLRTGPLNMPCDYGYSAADATDSQIASWWSSHTGIPPAGGVNLVDGLADGRDLALPGLLCLHQLYRDEGQTGEQLRAAIEATRASAQLPDIPVLVIHGQHDGLIPAALSSRPYVTQAREAGADIAYWEVANAQHFDALLAAPAAAERLVPILPFGWAGLDHVWSVLSQSEALGPDRDLLATPAPPGQVLERANLGLD